MTNLKIGIVGCGVTGGTLYKWLKENTDHDVFREDPSLGFDEISEPDKLSAMFICVPVPTIEGATPESWIQDTRILKDVIKKYRKYDRLPIYVRSTVLPKTVSSLRKYFKMSLYSMPEFLTERESYETMCIQDIICGVEENSDSIKIQTERLETIFPGKKILLGRNREAEAAKMLHNNFGAMKVNFFNMAAKYCENIGANYSKVLEMVLMSGYINEMHTMVPGPDGKHGYGGKCFPDNTLAFYGECKRMGMHAHSLRAMLTENVIHRLFWDKYFFTDPDKIKLEIKSE